MAVFTAPTIVDYNTSPPADDGSQVAANLAKYATIKDKLADPVKTYVDDLVAAVAAAVDTLTGYTRDHNILINGDFRVAQRGTTFTSATTPANNDDTYLLDRWVLLSDGNDAADVSQETTTVPTGSYAALKLDVETANKKFGILQIVEARDAKAIIGGTCSLSFKARVTGSTISRIRAGVLAWSSTADTVTSDVVSAWGAAGTNPTLVSNWTFENVPADLTALTTSYQTYTIENISIDTASCTNVAVFIWTDDVTMDVGDFLYIADVQLEPSPVATNFKRIPYSEMLRGCQRFRRVLGGVSGSPVLAAGYAHATTGAEFAILFDTPMRTAPSATFSGNGDFLVRDANTGSVDTTVMSSVILTAQSALINATVASGLTDAQGTVLLADSTPGTILFDAEL